MDKKIIAVLLALAVSVPPFPQPAYGGFTTGKDVVVEKNAGIDIMINSGEGSSIKASDIEEKLKKEVEARLEQAVADGLIDEMPAVRTSSPVRDASTDEVEKWWVYDNRDYNYGSVGIPALNPEEEGDYEHWYYGSSTGAFSGSATAAEDFDWLKDPLTQPSYGAPYPKMLLEEWVNRAHKTPAGIADPTPPETFLGDGRPKTYGSAKNFWGYWPDTLGAFEKHILVHNKGAVPYIDFVGYSRNPHQDFMLFPCTSAENKQVQFQIDSGAVNPHTLDGAGFLVNAGIEAADGETDVSANGSGVMTGYLLYYTYRGGGKNANSYKPVNLTLYKIRDDIDIDPLALHNTLYGPNTASNLFTSKTEDSNLFTEGGTDGHGVFKKLDSYTIDPNAWQNKMDIRLTISENKLILEQKPASSEWGSSSAKSYNFPENYNEENPATWLEFTGTNWFGPYVSYLSHACTRASMFTYSGISMQYINQNNNIYEVLHDDTNYVQNAEKFFIDLSDDGKEREVFDSDGVVDPTLSGTEAAAIMQTNEIDYLTNTPESELEIINATPQQQPDPAGPPNGNNGIRLSGDNADDIVDSAADYIVGEYIKRQDPTYTRPQNNLTLGSGEPRAALQLVSDAANPKSSYIDEIRKDLITSPEKGYIYGYDSDSAASKNQRIDKFIYELTRPDGIKVTLKPETGENYFSAPNQGSSQPLFKVTNTADWPIGTYTVKLTVEDSSGQTASQTVSFRVLEDTSAPSVPKIAIDPATGKISIDSEDSGYGLIGYEYTVTPEGETFDEAELKNYADSIGADFDKDEESGKITVSIPAKPDGSLPDAPLLSGDYSVSVAVFDDAGNKTEVQIPVIDYVAEEIISPGIPKNPSDWPVTDGKITGIGGKGPASAELTVSTTVTDKYGTSMPDGATEVTLNVPGRPPAPDVSAVKDSQGNPSFIDNDDPDIRLEYDESEDGNYWLVRRPAVPGQNFASEEARIEKSAVPNGDLSAPKINELTVDPADGAIEIKAEDTGGGYELIIKPGSGGIDEEKLQEAADNISGADVNTEADGTIIITVPAGSGGKLPDAPLPKGDYSAVLVVKDDANNKTQVNIPSIDYENEKLLVTDGTATNTQDIVPDITATEVTVTADNKASDEDDKPLASGQTAITVVIPPRPQAPPNIDAIRNTDGTVVLTDADDPSRTVESRRNEENDGYYVRYPAVPGESFAGLETEISDINIADDNVSAPVVNEITIDPKTGTVSVDAEDAGGGYEIIITHENGETTVITVPANPDGSLPDITAPLPDGNYFAEIVLTDDAGNKISIELPSLDYEDEKLVFADGTTKDVTPGAAPGTADVIVNGGVTDKYGTASTGGNTAITVNIPARPSAPDITVSLGADGSLIIEDASDSGIQLDKRVDAATGDTYVRYPAVPGESFASPETKVEPPIPEPPIPEPPPEVPDEETLLSVIARLDGHSWNELGGGLPPNPGVITLTGPDGTVYSAYAEADEDGVPLLYRHTDGEDYLLFNFKDLNPTDYSYGYNYNHELNYDGTSSKVSVNEPASGDTETAETRAALDFYSFNFHPAGGTLSGIEKTITAKGGTVDRPSDPLRPAFPFLGWNKSESDKLDEPWAFSNDSNPDILTAPTDVYAIWGEIRRYEISGEITVNDGGRDITELEVTVEISKGGQSFGKDNVGKGGDYSFSAIPDGIYSVDVTAVYSYNDEDGNEYEATVTKTESIKASDGGAGGYGNITIDLSIALTSKGVAKAKFVDKTDLPQGQVEVEFGVGELEHMIDYILPDGDGDKGITSEDYGKIMNSTSPGALEIVLYAQEFKKDGYYGEKEDEQKSSMPLFEKAAESDKSSIKSFFNIWVNKYIWNDKSVYDAAPLDYSRDGVTTKELSELPSLVRVDIMMKHPDLAGKNADELIVYRIHKGTEEDISHQANSYGEYFTVSGNMMSLYTRRFSAYAIALRQSEGGGAITPPVVTPPAVTPPVTTPPVTTPPSDSGGKKPGGSGSSSSRPDRKPRPAEKTETAKTEVEETSGEPAGVAGLNSAEHLNYIVGYKDGLIHPKGLITREETASIFFRLLEESYLEEILSFESPYEDISSANWSLIPIATLTNGGILSGRGLSYDPYKPITRAEFVSILTRFAKLSPGSVRVFDDTAGHWAEGSINAAAARGWIFGDEGRYRPDDPISRAEAMAIVNRALERFPEENGDLHPGMVKWPDNSDPDEWYFLDVQEATNNHSYRKKSGEKAKYETWLDVQPPYDYKKYEAK